MTSSSPYAAKILKHLSAQFPEPAEVLMVEIVEHFGEKAPCEAFSGAMELLKTEGYLTYQYSLFGKQLYSLVILTEKGLAASAGNAGAH